MAGWNCCLATPFLKMATPEVSHQVKIILLGDGTTGKTSLATRISQNNFSRKYDQTLGVEFYMRRMELPGGVQATLQVWDIGGQTAGGKMLDNYIYGAHVVLLVYDITKYSSFENLEDWLSDTKRVFQNSDKPLPYIVLVANKIDLEHMRTVKREQHIEFAKKHRIGSYSLSAKTDDMVYQCFLKVTAAVLRISLTAADLDTSQKVVHADVSSEKNPTPSSSKHVLPIQSSPAKSSSGNNRTRSVICSLQ